MRRGRATIAVFARAPLPGQTKSRLIPLLGAWGAARLHRLLLCRTLEVARATGARVELHGLPNARHALLVTLARHYRIQLLPQRGANLGERMYRALKQGQRRSGHFILIGSDIPVFTADYLGRALRLLAAGRHAVLGPAEDGGYALIGLRGVKPEIFQTVQWGGADVLSTTAATLNRLGYRWQALDAVWDVDRPEDLARFERIRWRRSFSAGRRASAR